MNIMGEITLRQTCEKLDVTAPWVEKVITKLNMKRKGRGSRRIFTVDEFVRIRNVKILRLCGMSWSRIENLKQPEDFEDIVKTVRKNRDLLSIFLKAPHHTLP